jgi:hypothetical protein
VRTGTGNAICTNQNPICSRRRRSIPRPVRNAACLCGLFTWSRKAPITTCARTFARSASTRKCGWSMLVGTSTSKGSAPPRHFPLGFARQLPSGAPVRRGQRVNPRWPPLANHRRRRTCWYGARCCEGPASLRPKVLAGLRLCRNWKAKSLSKSPGAYQIGGRLESTNQIGNLAAKGIFSSRIGNCRVGCSRYQHSASDTGRS